MAVYANVIDDVPMETFNYLLYPEQSPLTKNYIINQLDHHKHALLDTGKQYLEQAKNLYERINDNSVIRKAKAALRLAKGAVKPDIIMELNTLEEIRSAQPIMQRYNMACPELRKLYNDQLAQGYGDFYYDAFPGTLGDTHHDYREVMNGMVVETDNGDGWKVTTYAHESIETDNSLTFENKVDIIHTWDLIRLAIKAREDPSSIEGEKL